MPGPAHRAGGPCTVGGVDVKSAGREAAGTRSAPVAVPLLRMKLLPAFWYLVWPTGLSNVFQSAVEWTVLRFLGTLGPAVLGAVGLSRNLLMWASAPLWALAVGAVALAARYRGASDEERVKATVLNSMLLAVTVSGAIAAAGWMAAPWLLKVMGARGDIHASALVYLRWLFVGTPFMINYFNCLMLLRALGEARTALYIQAACNLCHLALTYLLIFGPGPLPALGVPGAGMAFALSRLVGWLLGLGVFLGGRSSVVLTFADFRLLRPDIAILRALGRLGAPNLVENWAWSSGRLVLVRIVVATATGGVALSAYTVGTQVEGLLMMAGNAAAMATSALVGQYLGAGSPRTAARATHLVARVCGVSFGALGAVLLGAAPQVAGLFSRDPAVLAYSASYIRMLGVTSVFYSLIMVYAAALRGAGDTRSPMYVSLLNIWLVQVPLSWLLGIALGWGPAGIWRAIGCSFVLQCAMLIWSFRRGTWARVAL